MNHITPPPIDDTLDHERLLSVITAHPEAAHALAAIAEGTPPGEAMASFMVLPKEDTREQSDAPEQAPRSDEGSARLIYQQAGGRSAEPESVPAFLANVRKSFWL